MKKKPASNRIDMTGKVYNSWKVNSYSHTNGKITIWNCECLECGRKEMVDGRNIRQGLSKRCVECGLKLSSEKNIGVSKAKQPEELVFRYIRKAYKNGAKKRGFVWELTDKDVQRLVLSNCDYCGRPPSNKCYPMRGHSLTPENSQRSIVRNGIDRIDSAKGYTIDNVVPCCTQCNSAKLDSTREEFLAWIERVYKFNLERSK